LKINLQLVQRIRAAGGLSGIRPFDWHDGQITTLDSTLKINLQLVQRIRAASGLSGIRPFDWHDGQITSLDNRPSCRLNSRMFASALVPQSQSNSGFHRHQAERELDEFLGRLG